MSSKHCERKENKFSHKLVVYILFAMFYIKIWPRDRFVCKKVEIFVELIGLQY